MGSGPTMIGLIPVAYALPGIIFGSWAGVIADRFRKIPIMMFCNLMVGLVITIALLFVQDIHWLLVALMVVPFLLFSIILHMTNTNKTDCLSRICLLKQ